MPIYPPVPAGGGGTTVATDPIWDAAGDLAIGTGSDTAARLAIGANNTVLTSNGTTATWSAPSAGSLSNAMTTISSNVTMTTAGTFYDGPVTATLAAGTWFLCGSIAILASSTATREWNVILWDGATVNTRYIHRTEGTAQAGYNSCPVSAIVTASGSQAFKISATSTVNADTISAAGGILTCYLNAIRLA